MKIAAIIIGIASLGITSCVPMEDMRVRSTGRHAEEGLASWYGMEGGKIYEHGKKTASGRPYDMHAMTAAHKTLPLGTRVKVTNLENNRTIVVVINDRGPYIEGRIQRQGAGACADRGLTMKKSARERLILPLDTGDPDGAIELARALAPWAGTFKFTPDAVISRGEWLISEVKGLGRRIFLDMKLYDIPETVRRACRTAASLGVDFITVHASGGQRMLEFARAGAREGNSGPSGLKVIAVTVLTSFEQSDLERDWKMKETIEERVIHWARMARSAGSDGVVCSPLELDAIRRELGQDMLTIVPGIRGLDDERSDQRRTLSAGEAIAKGADYLVVGRPIIKHPNPAAAAESIIRQIEAASQ
jgi:orotidine-5'-phosphate decarboxylase